MGYVLYCDLELVTLCRSDPGDQTTLSSRNMSLNCLNLLSRLNHSAPPRDKTHAARFLNGYKSIPGKVRVNIVNNNSAFVNIGNYT